jgi:hypothetical protein
MRAGHSFKADHHPVIPAKAGGAFQQRSWSSHFNSEAGHRTSAPQQRSQPSLQPFATATAIPAFAGMTSKTPTPSFRRRPESHFNSEAGHRTSALQQRSQPSLQPFATATAIPAFAGMTSKPTTPSFRRRPESHFNSEAGHRTSALQQRSQSPLPPFATATAIPAFAGMTSKTPNIVIPAKAGMTNKTGSLDTPYGSAWAFRLVNMAECPIPAAEYQQEPPE